MAQVVRFDVAAIVLYVCLPLFICLTLVYSPFFRPEPVIPVSSIDNAVFVNGGCYMDRNKFVSFGDGCKLPRGVAQSIKAIAESEHKMYRQEGLFQWVKFDSLVVLFVLVVSFLTIRCCIYG
nr:triple gene block protein 3 [Wheat yellow stripe virus]